MTPTLKRSVRAALLRFYRTHQRDLPWRRTRDPYAIWVSEVMLQQTQVETVVPRYGEFLRRYPTVEALARAPEHEVCEAWAGLGYYRRARNLHAAALQIARDYGGVIPKTAAQLMRLSGVGRYTAGAIASIAFGESAPLVDGNVARVLSRLFALALRDGLLRSPPQGKAGERALWRLASQLVEGEAPGDLNQALMELGATVCTPRSPACRRCPVRRYCQALAKGEPERYPPRRKAPARRLMWIAFAWVESPRGLYLVQRPLDGLWSGLWELPSASGHNAKRLLSAELGVSLARPIAKVRHMLTHREIRASIYDAAMPGQPRLRLRGRCVPKPLEAPLSALARKAIAAVLEARTDHSQDGVGLIMSRP